MALTSKLIIYNEALRELSAAPLANLVTANKSMLTLDTAFNQAVEYVLAKQDWNFARRRATLTTTADTTFVPYTVRYTKPSDYLRKVTLKRSADDEFQTEHAEIASLFYGHANNPVLEYISDTADSYEPANWPPHFTRICVIYLALLAAPSIARAGADEIKLLYDKLSMAERAAEDAEVVFTPGTVIATDRIPVMRRAVEMMGQTIGGALKMQSHLDRLRWHMNKAWGHSIKSVLEQGAWNFATRRATLTTGTELVPGDVYGITEGYSVAPATETDPSNLPDMAGYDYGYPLPDGFLHKIWLKADANHDRECPHQFMRSAVYANVEPIVLEYIAEDSHSTDPANWTATFLDAVAAHLALTVCSTFVVEQGGKGAEISANRARGELEETFLRKLSDAKNKDAIQQYPQSIPSGMWARARAGSNVYSMRRPA